MTIQTCSQVSGCLEILKAGELTRGPERTDGGGVDLPIDGMMRFVVMFAVHNLEEN